MDAFGHLSTRLAERKIKVSKKVSRNSAQIQRRIRVHAVTHVVYGCWHNLVQSVQKVSRSANRAGQFCAVLWREPKKCPKVSKTADSVVRKRGLRRAILRGAMAGPKSVQKCPNAVADGHGAGCRRASA